MDSKQLIGLMSAWIVALSSGCGININANAPNHGGIKIDCSATDLQGKRHTVNPAEEIANAIELIERKAPQFMPTISHIKAIKCVPGTWTSVDVNAGIVKLREISLYAGSESNAITLVHEATHIEQFKNGKPYAEYEGEKASFERQNELASIIDPQQVIDVEQTLSYKHWEEFHG